ncbi:adenine nucleotide alpha hydrolases-like protein [Viridothelium virens]|uniref:FAD synthase n=1 Tax=Viridothelium virens TaxID=1048519 RepID=A0A6A6HQ77_VIRVR|nr:adenine nucleotide alpha hydrolases-like protein [Viridothelium virens]
MQQPHLGVQSDEQGRTSTIDPTKHEDLSTLCQRLHARVSAFIAAKAPEQGYLRSTQEQTRVSLRVIEEALDRYSLDQLSLSYNGGKDCLVLLVLFLASLHTKRLSSNRPLLQSVFILSAHPFAEVDDFVNDCIRVYSLDLARYAKPMKAAFEDYLNEKPNVKAILVGTRRTDPHGENLTHFDETDRGWPRFMRVHPVIDWHYAEIWTFIRHLEIPYCPLYDKGYTSLGGTTDTHPNPALKHDIDAKGNANEIKYRPAYELIEDNEERLGRDR